jgi:hypothetical protein
MDTKSVLKGIEEFRQYLLGEAPMLVGGVDDDIKDLVPTYFTGEPNPNAEIWKFFEYVNANPEQFEMELKQHYLQLLSARRSRVVG